MNTQPAVLVVEDETLIRMFAADLVIDAGFRVVEASDAAEAISKLEEDSGIGIVFTDIHMPGSVDGLAMTHTVRDRWPPIQFLVVSGHKRPGEGEMPAGTRFIPKPYTSKEIISALHEMADRWRVQVSAEA